MENSLPVWKKKLHEYYFFLLLQFGLITLVSIKFVGNYFYVFYAPGSEIISTALMMAIWATLIIGIGIFIKDNKPLLKISGGLLVAIGIGLQVFYMSKLKLSVLTHKIAILFLIAAVITAVWSVILFFVLDKEALAEIKMKTRKKNGTYYVLAVGIVTVASSIFLYRYFNGQINELIASGAVNQTNGIMPAQIVGLVDAKIAQVDLLQTVLLVVISAVFIWPYKKWVIGQDSQA